MKWLVVLAVSSGCAQLLGLDDTKFDQKDAAIDAPEICDGAPACNSGTGRSVCGQIYGLGATAGIPLRTAQPTGMFCVAIGIKSGPCAVAVTGMSLASLFDGTGAGHVDGTVDDCGRFVIPDLDAGLADVAVVLSGIDVRQTASLVIGRETVSGADKDVEAFAMTDAVAAEWATQLVGSGPAPDLSAGYLIRFTSTGAQMPISVARDGSSALTNSPMTPPWAVYFGATPFGTIDPTATATQASGTAFAVPGAGTFSLQGVRVGRRCSVPVSLQQLANTLIFVIAKMC